MRVAVIDIGTNSTRLLVADVEHGRVTAELERRSTVTRLGDGVDASGALACAATERVLAVLDGYSETIEASGARHSVAVLTSAVRDAANGREFAATVERRYHLQARILDGDAEAALTFAGATSERDPGDPAPLVVIDIGGGSTELVVGARGVLCAHASTQAGVVRQSERHLAHDPPTPGQLAALRDEVRELVERAIPKAARDATRAGVAVAGTATSLAAIDQALEPYDPERVHGYVLPARTCHALLERLAAMPLGERRRLAGLHPDRAPTIVAGAAILVEALAAFALTEVEVSEHDILRGAALELGR